MYQGIFTQVGLEMIVNRRIHHRSPGSNHTALSADGIIVNGEYFIGLDFDEAIGFQTRVINIRIYLIFDRVGRAGFS